MALKHVYLHQLDTLKGWFSGAPTDFVAKLSANVDATARPVGGGRVVHLNADGEYELGVTGHQMAIFLMSPSDGYDVSNDGDVMNDPFGYQAVHPAGNLGGLVAIGGGEINTTEYDTTETYAPNDPLASPTEADITGADKSAAGLVYGYKNWPGGNTNQVAVYTDPVIGIVSRGVIQNMHRRNALAFWPVYLPETA